VRLKTEEDSEITTQLIGDYNFENIATALCIGKYFGVPAHQANEAIAQYQPANMRSQVVKKGTNTVILDAYNANPSSLQAAIESLAAMHTNNKVAIVGDMFELEDEAEAEHKNIGKLLKQKGINRVYLCGTLMRYAKEVFPEASYFETKSLLAEELRKNPIQYATILVKASRGIGLETVIDFL
jgi:UDP-N-acetylmuramoyl-tripeptide--D-alanyl-D-alanine ligase